MEWCHCECKVDIEHFWICASIVSKSWFVYHASFIRIKTTRVFFSIGYDDICGMNTFVYSVVLLYLCKLIYDHIMAYIMLGNHIITFISYAIILWHISCHAIIWRYTSYHGISLPHVSVIVLELHILWHTSCCIKMLYIIVYLYSQFRKPYS